MLRLVRNDEERERSRHPLQPIMVMRDGSAQAHISTTDVHVARRIGEALKHAFQGALEVRYSRDESFVRVKWTRD